MAVKYTNRATSLLASNINTSVTSLSVTAATGARFPALAAGEWFPLVVVAADGAYEIMRATARAGDVITVTRAQEGTAALSFLAGARVDLRLTSAMLADIVSELQAEVDTVAAAAALAALKTNNGSDFASPHAAFDNLSLHGDDVVAAATVNLTTATGYLIDITGNTAITAVTLAEGKQRWARFTGTPVLTNGASLVVQGGTRTMAAGDYVHFKGDAAGVVCATVFRADGKAAIGPSFGDLTGGSYATPQGVLSPTSNVPVIASDVIGASSLFYMPRTGNFVPIYENGLLVPKTFAQLTLALVSNHLANAIYDKFVFDDAGTRRIVTGPAWTVATAGACVRGAGAGTSELENLDGIYVNKVAITGRNGGTTYSIAARAATYVGSIFVDDIAGQVTCHRTWGTSRKWGVWNAYNRRNVYLKAGDGTASWPYTTQSTYRPSNNSLSNSLKVFAGLAEDEIDIRFAQLVVSMSGIATKIGIGINSTTLASGYNPLVGGTSDTTPKALVAEYSMPATLGLTTVTSLEYMVNGVSGATFYGTENNMILSAKWMA